MSPVAAESMDLVSLTWGTFPGQASAGRLVISVPGATSLGATSLGATSLGATSAAHIRATGIPFGLYYRLDADVPPGGAFTWPTDELLSKLGIRLDQVGLFSLARSATGEFVYRPVAVNVRASDDKPMVVELRPAVPTDAARWRLILPDSKSTGWTGATVTNDRVMITIKAADAQQGGTLEIVWADPDGRRLVKNLSIQP